MWFRGSQQKAGESFASVFILAPSGSVPKSVSSSETGASEIMRNVKVMISQEIGNGVQNFFAKIISTEYSGGLVNAGGKRGSSFALCVG